MYLTFFSGRLYQKKTKNKKTSVPFPTCIKGEPYMKMEASWEFTENLVQDFALPHREVMTGEWFVK